MRLIWVYQFSDVEEYKFNNEFMINSNDGYYFAEGAREILSNINHNDSNTTAINSALSYLTSLIAKSLPIKFETIIFYMPAFFSSLIVIPLILIARSIGKLEVGFIAALIGSITWSYYNRTMVGYYDTDLLNIVFPTVFLWSIIWAIKTQENKYLIFTALDILAYRWWYPQSYSLEFAFSGLIALYVIYQIIRKEDYMYNFLLLIFILVAMMNLDGEIRLLIVSFLFFLIILKKEFIYNNLYYLFGLSIILFIITGGVTQIVGLLKSYVFKSDIIETGYNLTLHFFSVMQTIRESSAISLETLANRISGHTITFLLSLIGYIWLVYKHRIMILGLPMLGLGFLAYSSGLRFTIYAVPILALGVAFLIVELSDLLKNRVLKYFLMIVLTSLALIPNIQHIISYKIPTVFTKSEVVILDKLKKISNKKDYIVSWWDYGYPIRYYTHAKTLIDGSKHDGNTNFPISFALMSPQTQSAKMLRLVVEKGLDMENLIHEYGYTDTNPFLKELKKNIKYTSKIKQPTKTSDIYLYLPRKILDIFPTVKLFSNIDLLTGKKKEKTFFYKSTQIKMNGGKINIGNGVSIILKKEVLQIGKKTIAINRIVKTKYNKKGKLIITGKIINKKSNFNVIFMSDYKSYLVVDNATFNSTYMQLFVFENYNKNLFEPVILSPLAKVYKVKI